MNEIIDKTIVYVQKELESAEKGHDWWHTKRVFDLVTFISQKEGGDLLTIQLSSLLHDIADYKFNNGNEEIGIEKAKGFLKKISVNEQVISHVEKIMRNISFKGGNVRKSFKSLELDIVQDADRIDAIGAIGIARAFHYGGYKNREFYNPSIEYKLNMSVDEYINSKSTTINHFYEKLLMIKENLNTDTAKKLAKQKHDFMEEFLNEFFIEWNIPNYLEKYKL